MTATKELKERADALGVLCCTLFGTDMTPFRLEYWATCFRVEVILYALVEAELKQRRTEGMTPLQVATFAEKVMLNRSGHQKRKTA